MKKTFLLGFLALWCGLSMLSAQVGINTEEPKATLDIVAAKTDGTTAEGVIAPRLDRAALNAKEAKYTAAQTGAIVYVNNAANGTAAGQAINVTSVGYYYFDGTVWLEMAVGSAVALKITQQPKAFSWSRIKDAYGDPAAPASPTVAKLKVTAIGSGLSYQWYRKNRNKNAPAVKLAGETNDDFAPPVTAWGMESYFVVVKNNTNDSVISNIAEVALGCGAKTIDGGWLKMACYNHGVTTADKSNDPFTYKTGTDEGSTTVKYYGAGGILGAFYQWGRNDSVPRTSVGNVAGPYSTSGSANTFLAKGDNQITSAHAAYGNFITGPDAAFNYDWRQGYWDFLWYANRGNPCPSGWWMPTQTDWGSITGGGTNRVSAAQTTANSMEFVQGYKFKPDGSTVTLFLPAAGYRSNGGGVSYVTSYGHYWSSTSASSMAFSLNFDNNYLYPADSGGRAAGRSVRCVQQ
jgi:uncharacterized protein (TIGR02145 family)